MTKGEMFALVKKRCGIADASGAYDIDIEGYLADCEQDMLDSDVPKSTVENRDQRVATAATLYVKAHIGNDRTDTEKYLKLYREKVSRLTLDEAKTACGTEALS